MLMHTSILLIFFVYYCFGHPSDSVRLSDISALTFVRGQLTTSRRSSPISQLECVGGSAQRNTQYHPETVQCRNVGFDGFDVQWECKSDLDSKVKFGRTVVSCEGYTHRDDPNVLVGSCGLKYNLDFTTSQNPNTHSYQDASQIYNYGSSHGSSFGTFIAFVGFMFLVYMVISIFSGRYYRSTGYNGYNNPSSYNGYNNPGPYNGYNNPGPYNGYNNPGPYNNYAPSQGYGGFWTGLATGGLLSSLFRPSGYGYGSGYGHHGYSRGYGSSYGSSYGSGYGSGSSGYSSPSSGSSGSRTATGYATTERR